jgi:hypothetical protein
MITTHNTTLAPQNTPEAFNQSNFFNSMAMSIAEEQCELCYHWVKNKICCYEDSSNEDQEIPAYNLNKIRLIFEEADNTRNQPFRIRVQCLSCQRKNIRTQENRFQNTERLLTKQFLHIYEVNLNQNQRHQLEF